MIGHETLIALRMKGYKPSSVFVSILRGNPDYTVFTHPDMVMSLGGQPEIDLGPDDSPSTADFRCVVGLPVHLVGEDETRVLSVADRVIKFRPLWLLASGFSDEYLYRWTPTGGMKRVEAQ